LLEKGVTAKAAVASMCAATADPEFRCRSAREIRRDWQKALFTVGDDDD
jgi:hypothetical protein